MNDTPDDTKPPCVVVDIQSRREAMALRDGERRMSGQFWTPGDVGDLMVSTREADGSVSLGVLAPPENCIAWSITDADDVERLGVLLIRHAVKMRGFSGPP